MKIEINLKAYVDFSEQIDISEYKKQSEAKQAYYKKYEAGSFSIIYGDQQLILEPEDLHYILDNLFLRMIPSVVKQKKVRGALWEKEHYGLVLQPLENDLLNIYEYYFTEKVANEDRITQNITVPQKEFLQILYESITRFNQFYIAYSGKYLGFEEDIKKAEQALKEIL